MRKTNNSVGEKLRAGFIYFLLSTLVLAVVLLSYLLRSVSLSFMDLGGWVYFVASCLSHVALFAALPLLLLYVPAALLSGTLMAVGEALVAVAAVINGYVYAIYHFHINGLVLSMLTGPGASEIFVFSPWLYVKGTLYIAALVLFYALLLWLALRLARRPWPHLWRRGLLVIAGITLLAQGMHIYAAATMKRSVLESTGYLPYYFPLTMNSLLDKMGLIDGDRLNLTQFDDGGGDGSLAYPLKPLEVEPVAGNVVIFDKTMNQLDDYPLNARQLNDAILRLNRFYKK